MPGDKRIAPLASRIDAEVNRAIVDVEYPNSVTAGRIHELEAEVSRGRERLDGADKKIAELAAALETALRECIAKLEAAERLLETLKAENASLREACRLLGEEFEAAHDNLDRWLNARRAVLTNPTAKEFLWRCSPASFSAAFRETMNLSEVDTWRKFCRETMARLKP